MPEGGSEDTLGGTAPTLRCFSLLDTKTAQCLGKVKQQQQPYVTSDGHRVS